MANDTTKVKAIDTTYCMPIGQARAVFGDALKFRKSEILVKELHVEITLEKENSKTQADDFNKQLTVEREKTKVAEEERDNQQSLTGNYKKEAEDNLKQSKRHRNERNVVILLWVATIAAFVL